MANIIIELDTKADANAADIAAEISAVTSQFPGVTFKMDGEGIDNVIILEGQFPAADTLPKLGRNTGTILADPPAAPITRVVQVRGQYTYLLYVDDHGEVREGGTVDIEAKNGGHWNGKVTRVWPTVEDYIESEGGEAPSLYIIGVIDPGPAY